MVNFFFVKIIEVLVFLLLLIYIFIIIIVFNCFLERWKLDRVILIFKRGERNILYYYRVIFIFIGNSMVLGVFGIKIVSDILKFIVLWFVIFGEFWNIIICLYYKFD